MSYRQERIELQQPLTFHSISGTEILTNITELLLRIDDEAGEALLTMSFETDFSTYEQVEKRQLFNLFPQICHAQDHDFSTDRPIALQACLRHSVLIESGSELAIEPIAQAIFDPNQPALTNHYRLTESWLLQTVRQAVPLPDELAGTGTLESGYTTLWNDTYFSRQG
jgi:hypothetical protein